MPLAWLPPQQDPALANRKEEDVRAVLLQEYGDHGQWARHYSTVRMTLGTFFITAATGVITLRWDNPQVAIAVTAVVIFSIGVFLFLIFSHLTFEEMNAQFNIADSYRKVLETSPTATPARLKWWKSGTGLPVAILFVAAFLSFDGWWLLRSTPGSRQTTQISIPMKVKVGQQPEVTIDVPLKVTVP